MTQNIELKLEKIINNNLNIMELAKIKVTDDIGNLKSYLK